MGKHLSGLFFIVFFSAGVFKVAEIQAETTIGKFYSEPLRTFNPFSVKSWFNLPSQIAQYWFPLFQPQYYPSYLQRPTTTTTTTTEKVTHDSEPKTDNIFGISGSPDDDIEYLPSENKIEW